MGMTDISLNFTEETLSITEKLNICVTTIQNRPDWFMVGLAVVIGFTVGYYVKGVLDAKDKK